MSEKKSLSEMSKSELNELIKKTREEEETDSLDFTLEPEFEFLKLNIPKSSK